MTTTLTQRHPDATVSKPPFGNGKSCLVGFLFGPIAAGIIADLNSYRLGYPARAHFTSRALLIVIGLFLLTLIPSRETVWETVRVLLGPLVSWLFAIWISDSQRAAYHDWHHTHLELTNDHGAEWLELVAIGFFWWLTSTGVLWGVSLLLVVIVWRQLP